MKKLGEPSIGIQLDAQQGPYGPGTILEGRYRLAAADPQEVRAVELSVLWYTSGQGEEDMAVHFFQRTQRDDNDQDGGGLKQICSGQHFQSRLPNSPLSYDGIIVKICWCVRVRAFLARGRDIVAEEPFQLGNIPPAKLV